jgi:signal transduction histidine kinase
MKRASFAGEGRNLSARGQIFRKPCLLLTDDQPANIEALYRILAPDHQVLMATSGEKALSICRENPPDAVLLDVTMPGMDGFQVIRHLKADPLTADIPVLFVTARDDAEAEALGLALGAVDFIVKPFNAAVVRARVRNHIELASARALLDATLDATADGIAVTDLQGDLVTCNQRFSRLMNTPSPTLEAGGRPLAGAFNADLQPLMEVGSLSEEDAPKAFELRDGRVLQRHRMALRMHGQVTGHVLNLRDVTELRQAQATLDTKNAELQQLLSALQTAQEDERRRIALDIHDELQQKLAAIRMELGLQTPQALSSAPDGFDVSQQLVKVDRLVAEVIDATRRIVMDLRPQILDDLGLAAALDEMMSRFAKRKGIDFDLEIIGDAARADADFAPIATCLYRIAQESLNNIHKHAGASFVHLCLDLSTPGRVTLSVHDDGKGIRPEDRGKRSAFGLPGMEERVRALGGSLAVCVAAGGGTTVRATVPGGVPVSP